MIDLYHRIFSFQMHVETGKNVVVPLKVRVNKFIFFKRKFVLNFEYINRCVNEEPIEVNRNIVISEMEVTSNSSELLNLFLCY